MWRWITIGIISVGALLTAVLIISARKPAARLGENGTFVSDCCGTITLADGKMLLNEQRSIGYKVMRDANGPYILPRVYIGAVPDFGFDVDGTRSILKLRLDRLPAPSRIVLHEGLTPYAFKRQDPAATRR
jgi:hypothetical protein